MDRISQLSDELLLKILSLLPTANDVMVTMVLSKRWQFLWTMVSKLVYDDSYQNIEYTRFSRFVDRSLCLLEAPMIDTLHFKIGESCGPDDIRVWIRVAIKRCLRELILESNISSVGASWFILPRSFYIGFLHSCPVLEDLILEKCPDDNVSTCTVRVPFMKRLSLSKYGVINHADGFVINTPSLVSLMITDDGTHGFCDIESEMPKIGKILGFVTSVKHLYLCLTTAEDAEEEKEVVEYILRNGVCLKKVTISSKSSTDCDKKLEMLKVLTMSFRRSPTCQLAFN